MFRLSFVVLLVLLNACAAKRVARVDFLIVQELEEIRVAIDRGSHAQAIRELNMLLDLKPTHREALFLRALTYQKKGSFEKAASDYQSLLKQYPHDEKTLFNLGMLFAFHLSERSLALEMFDRFLTVALKHPKAFQVAKLMASIDRPHWNQTAYRIALERAHTLEACQQELKQYSTSTELHQRLAGEFLKVGDEQRASLHYRKATLFSL